MKKKLFTVIAAAIIFSMIPAVPASAKGTAPAATAKKTTAKQSTKTAKKKTAVKTFNKKTTVNKSKKTTVKKAYVPVNAKNLTASYRARLKQKRASRISVRGKSLAQRCAFEEKALIDLTWSEFQKYSQISVSRKEFDLMCRVVSAEAGDSCS